MTVNYLFTLGLLVKWVQLVCPPPPPPPPLFSHDAAAHAARVVPLARSPPIHHYMKPKPPTFGLKGIYILVFKRLRSESQFSKIYVFY